LALTITFLVEIASILSVVVRRKIFFACRVAQVKMTVLKSRKEGFNLLTHVVALSFQGQHHVYHLNRNHRVLNLCFQFQLSSTDVVVYQAVCQTHTWPPQATRWADFFFN